MLKHNISAVALLVRFEQFLKERFFKFMLFLIVDNAFLYGLILGSFVLVHAYRKDSNFRKNCKRIAQFSVFWFNFYALIPFVRFVTKLTAPKL